MDEELTLAAGTVLMRKIRSDGVSPFMGGVQRDRVYNVTLAQADEMSASEWEPARAADATALEGYRQAQSNGKHN